MYPAVVASALLLLPKALYALAPLHTWLRGKYVCINLFETQIFATSGGRCYANYACAHRTRKKNVAFMAFADQSRWWYLDDPAINAMYNIHLREMAVGMNVPQGVASTTTVRSLPIPQCIYPIKCVRTPSIHAYQASSFLFTAGKLGLLARKQPSVHIYAAPVPRPAAVVADQLSKEGQQSTAATECKNSIDASLQRIAEKKCLWNIELGGVSAPFHFHVSTC